MGQEVEDDAEDEEFDIDTRKVLFNEVREVVI